MAIAFKQETFRDDFSYRNSPENIRRFPFPFDRDEYMYSVNMEPHVKGQVGTVYESLIDVDEHYVAEMRDRALVLKEDPLRYQALPHMSRLPRAFHADQERRSMALDQPAARHRRHIHFRRRIDAAL